MVCGEGRSCMCVCDRVVWERYGKMVCVKVMCVFVRAAAVRTFSFAPVLQCHLLDIRRYCRPPVGWTKCARISCGALLTLMMLRGNIKACHWLVTTQKETFIAVVTKRKTPQNMKGLQAPHRHAASPRTCFCWPAVQNETFIAVVRKSKMPQNMKGVQAMHWHTTLLRTSTWRNEVWQDLLCWIADPHDAAWKHQSMSLTPVTTQRETFYCCSYKT